MIYCTVATIVFSNIIYLKNVKLLCIASVLKTLVRCYFPHWKAISSWFQGYGNEEMFLKSFTTSNGLK